MNSWMRFSWNLYPHNAPPPFFSLLFLSLSQYQPLSPSLLLGGGVQQLLWVVKEQLVCVWVCVCVWGAGHSHPSMTGISSPSISELHTPFKPAVLLSNTHFCLYSASHISVSLHHLFRLNIQLRGPTIYSLYFEFIT